MPQRGGRSHLQEDVAAVVLKAGVQGLNPELIKILGSHESKLRFANDPPSVFLIVGLQGSGKTTSTGKIARWLSKNGHKDNSPF